MSDKTKRKLTSYFAIIVLAVAIMPILYGCTQNPVSCNVIALDTVIKIDIYGGNQDLLDGCFDIITEYEMLMSATDVDSELYKLNANGGGTVDSRLAMAISEALEYCRLTDGAFDITLGSLIQLWDIKNAKTPPTAEEIAAAKKLTGYENVSVKGNEVIFGVEGLKLDLGAFAKGYISDVLREYLVSNDVKSAIINLGGNVVCIGKKPGGLPFKVGIQMPFEDSTKTAEDALELIDTCAVTSGSYQRYFEYDGKLYHHIIDPETGSPSDSGLTSVTVITKSGVMADALSTAFFVMGSDRATELMMTLDDDVRIVFIDSDGNIDSRRNYD